MDHSEFSFWNVFVQLAQAEHQAIRVRVFLWNYERFGEEDAAFSRLYDPLLQEIRCPTCETKAYSSEWRWKPRWWKRAPGPYQTFANHGICPGQMGPVPFPTVKPPQDRFVKIPAEAVEETYR